MKKQRLTIDEKKTLANNAFTSVCEKAERYPTWMQSYFHNDMDAYYQAGRR